MTGSSSDAKTEKATADLRRLEREGDLLNRSSLGNMARRAADHFGAADAREENDPIELWGRRIGRALSLIGVIALAIYLYVSYAR
ncbi:MAG: hypothetical protein AB7K04_09230 [Pseudorhodoplanes sp.]